MDIYYTHCSLDCRIEQIWVIYNRIFTNTSLSYRLLQRLGLDSLRHTYYLITPNESMFKAIEEVPNYNAEMSGWWFVLICLEFLFFTFKGHTSRYAFNDSIVSISAGILSQCFKFGGRAIAIFPYIYIWNNHRLIENPWNSPWTWIFCLFFQDFMYYLGHRAVHEIGLFWGLHAMHHSSEYYNFTTALRQAALQDVGLAVYDILQASFIPPSTFLVHRYFNEIYQFTLHTSCFDTYGPLGLVLNTPSHHRVHHGRNAYCIDRNYGGVFIIWDKLFGTFEAERPSEPPVYGSVKLERNFNQLWLQFHVMKAIVFDKWRMKDKNGDHTFQGLEKVKAIFYPPGYFPRIKVKQFFHWLALLDPKEGIPQIEAEVSRYNPEIPVVLKVYCCVHFMMLLSTFLHFEYDRLEITYIQFSAKIIFFATSMQCLGGFFDKRAYASFLEIIRCLSVVLYHIYTVSINNGEEFMSPSQMFSIAMFLSSAIIWICHNFIAVHLKARISTQKIISLKMLAKLSSL